MEDPLVSHAVVLEIFCGTAGVSAAFKKLGFDTIAVDKFVPKSPKVMVTKLDLTQACNQQLVFDWISLPQVKGVFLAPPCGTASLARTFRTQPSLICLSLYAHGKNQMAYKIFQR